MGQGLGEAQKRMLKALEGPGELTIAELVESVGLTPRRAHQVAQSLADRKLVVILRGLLGWKGVGEYGQLMPRKHIELKQDYFGMFEWIDLATIPTVLVKKGERHPGTVDDATAREIHVNASRNMIRRFDAVRRATKDMSPADAQAYRQKAERRGNALEREQMKLAKRRIMTRDVEFVHIGVPVYGLTVWSIEARRQWRADRIEQGRQLIGFLEGREPTEAEIVRACGPEV